MHALIPGIVPPRILPRAIAASACGPDRHHLRAGAGWPALRVRRRAVYFDLTALFVLASVLVSLIACSAPRSKAR